MYRALDRRIQAGPRVLHQVRIISNGCLGDDGLLYPWTLVLPGKPVIITGKASASSKAFYLDEGANGFFRKPVDAQALVDLIDDLLTRQVKPQP